MKRFIAFLVGLFIFASVSFGFAVDTGTVTKMYYPARQGMALTKIVWISTSGGAVSTTVNLYGNLDQTRFINDLGGIDPVADTDKPTNLYDMTLKDSTGLKDVLLGKGANLVTTNGTSETVVVSRILTTGLIDVSTTSTAHAMVPLYGAYTLAITNAGAATTGTILLYTKD